MVQLSVVIPTFDEGDNVVELLERLDKALLGINAEVIIVDDGTDDLPAIAAGVVTAVPVRIIRREVATGRLGGAVVHGFREARGALLLVQDGDLQHPPELIPDMVEAARFADLVVASRYIDGGDAGGLSGGTRKLVSRASGLLARLTFPRRLRKCSDPMSGMFLVRRSYLDLDALKPKGFKILIEAVARSRPMRVSEVPLVFGERTAGESHASLAEGLRYLRQLMALRLDNRVAKFAAVGASGVLPNLLAVLLLTGAGMHYLLAAVIAVQVAVSWNFLGAEFLVWKDHRAGHWLRRLGRFVAVAELDLLRLPFVAVLVHFLGGHAVIATLVTLTGSFLLRFGLADKLVYKRPVLLAESVGLSILEETA